MQILREVTYQLVIEAVNSANIEGCVVVQYIF